MSDNDADRATFLDGVVKYLNNVPTWGVPPRDLPLSQMIFGVGAAYDWLHDVLPEESKTKARDYIVAMARDPATGLIYIKEVERFRAGFNDVLTRIKAAAARHRPVMIAIEQTQYQAAVVQELARTTTLPVRGIRPDRDKLTRFAPLLTRYEQRMVRHDPSGCPSAFRDELLAFPEGEHDDMADAAAHAFAAIGQSSGPPASAISRSTTFNGAAI
jgi:predicted phage terminase large subunit-like protein